MAAFDLSGIDWNLFQSIKTEFFDEIYGEDRLSPLLMQVQDKAEEGEEVVYPYIKASTSIAQPWRPTGLAVKGTQEVETVKFKQRRIEVNYSVNAGLYSGEIGKSLSNLVEKFKYSAKKSADSQAIVMHVANHIVNKLRDERVEEMLLHGVWLAKPAPTVVGTAKQIYDGLLEIKNQLVTGGYTALLPAGAIPAAPTAGQAWQYFENAIKEIPLKIRRKPMSFLLPSVFFDKVLKDLVSTNSYEAQYAFSTSEFRAAKETNGFRLPGYPNVYVQAEDTMDIADGFLGWVNGNAQLVHHEEKAISETLRPIVQPDGKEVIILASKHECVTFGNPMLVFANV